MGRSHSLFWTNFYLPTKMNDFGFCCWKTRTALTRRVFDNAIKKKQRKNGTLKNQGTIERNNESEWRGQREGTK